MILDVDTGPDDAVAIIAALLAPELEVVGICSVNGNRE
ncbi:nucleoside hydrolase, partial [Clostridium sp. ATCC 29733]